MKDVDYSSDHVPEDYKCQECGATGCKLWRGWNEMPATPSLRCAICAAEQEGKDISTIDDDGKRMTDLDMRTDQIGTLLPAVPDEEGVGYWGYTSVPQAGCEWWRKLPTLPPSP